jgi:putative ABC transport system substrate-binding protein
LEAAMKRRDVIGLVGGVAAGWPLVTLAQQGAIPTVGVLSSRSAKETTELIAAFRTGLSETGFVEPSSVTIEFRWAEGRYDRLPSLSADLVARRVAVIVAPAMAPALAAKSATANIPIIFLTGVDPVQFGLVNSFNRPDANLTGVAILTNTLAPKQLALLREMVPATTRVAYLVNPKNPITETDVRDLRSVSAQEIVVVSVSSENDLDSAFTGLVKEKASAVLIQSDPILHNYFEKIVALAARHAMPAVYPVRDFAVAGGLMSYGTVLGDAYRQLGIYTGKILSGAKPSELPIQQSIKVELVINLKTAKTLGIAIPRSLLVRADEVIR